MLTFLTQLFETGEIIVPREAAADSDAVRLLLSRCESIARTDWPGIAPEFDVDVAEKSAMALLVFCQATVYRELDEREIQQRLNSIELAGQPTPTRHYSADLVLQFLPDVYNLLMRSAKEDPARQLLVDFAKQWPLSAVGIGGATPEELPKAVMSGCMFRAYVDRVIARSDVACGKLPIVSEAIREVIGDFPALASNFNTFLKPSDL